MITAKWFLFIKVYVLELEIVSGIVRIVNLVDRISSSCDCLDLDPSL